MALLLIRLFFKVSCVVENNALIISLFLGLLCQFNRFRSLLLFLYFVLASSARFGLCVLLIGLYVYLSEKHSSTLSHLQQNNELFFSSYCDQQNFEVFIGIQHLTLSIFQIAVCRLNSKLKNHFRNKRLRLNRNNASDGKTKK